MYSRKLNKIKSAVLSGMIAAVSVASSFTAVAPAVTANAAGSDNYAKLLQYSLYFYDANMCGDKVGETSGLTWRDNCHTGDEVKGGFHDAGDHVMFGLPQGYSASTLGWGYYEFKDAYNATGQASHFKTVSDYFCKFFKDSTKLDGSGNVTNFLYQKGEGDPDHAYWNAPEKQEQEQGTRKMYWTSNSGSDIAAEYAAALALNYLNFGNAEDLKYAEALYKFSTQYNQVATDGTTPFYSSQSCQDEQAWAAGWLYIATGNESYKSDCANKQVQYLGTNHCWENVQTGAACVYAEITGDWSKVNGWLEQYTNQSGYCFMSEWGSARSNTAMQLTALVASKNSSADYSSWVKGQMDFLLGNNPLNVCYVVGFDSNSAKNPHHRAASGMTNWDEFNASDVIVNGHTLVGALVGGPKSADGTNYTDTLKDAVCNEVAVDYNAAFVGAAAGLYDIYKTGSCDTSITGVDKIYSGTVTPSVTQPVETQAPVTQPPVTQAPVTQAPVTQTPVTPSPSGGDTVLMPSDMKVGTEKGDDGEMNNYAEFSPNGAKSATLYYKVNSNDMNTSGAFGTWTGTWEQKDFENVSVPSDKIVAVDYTIPSNVGTTVKAMVFWPHGDAVTIEKVVLHMDSSSNPVVTQAPVTQAPVTQTPTTPVNPSGSGAYEVKLNQSVDYTALPEDDKMIGWKWSDFNLPSGEKPTKVEINISANGNIGKWEGAFGSSTEVQPEYWTQTADMQETINGNSGTITWDISSADSSIIQTKYGGELKFGIWWIDCQQFTIDSIKVYTNGSSAPVTQPATTAAPKPTTTTANNTDMNRTLLGDANEDGTVNMADATAIIQHIGNKDAYGLSAQGIANANLCDNLDGITGMDAIAIQLLVAKQINQLPYIE